MVYLRSCPQKNQIIKKKKKKKKGFEKICNFTTAYLQASIEIFKHGSSCDYYATQLPIHL